MSQEARGLDAGARLAARMEGEGDARIAKVRALEHVIVIPRQLLAYTLVQSPYGADIVPRIARWGAPLAGSSLFGWEVRARWIATL